MKAKTRQAIFRVHAWVGLNLGLLLFVICFSGTVAVFSKELSWLVDPALRTDPPDSDNIPLSWQGLHDRVVAAHPHAAILLLQRPAGDRSVARAAISYGPGDLRWVLIDPQDGRIAGTRSNFSLTSFLRIFHKQLYIVPVNLGFHGTLVVGALALVLLAGAISGLLSISRWWRAFLTLRKGRSPRLFWSDLHRLTGVWPLLVTVILAVTGLWYFAENILQSTGVLVEDALPARLEAEAMRSQGPQLPALDLDRLAQAARDAYPALDIAVLQLPRRPGDPVIFTGQAEAWLVRDRTNRVEVDPHDGSVRRLQRAEDIPLDDRLIATADPLHFGDFAGMVSKSLWFAAGLMLSGGILAGLYGVWLRQRNRDRLSALPLSRLVLAILPTLTLLAFSLYGAWAYGGGAMRTSQQERLAVPLGQFVSGPWQFSAYLYHSADMTGLGLLFPGAARPNFRQAEIALTDKDGTLHPLPARRLADRLWAALPGEAAHCDTGCRLLVTLEGWDGTSYEAALPLSLATANAEILPGAEPVPIGEKIVMAVFVLLLSTALAGWLRLLRYA